MSIALCLLKMNPLISTEGGGSSSMKSAMLHHQVSGTVKSNTRVVVKRQTTYKQL